ncbi:hypothetical protein KI387_044551, partial [Taxus chinensis]
GDKVVVEGKSTCVRGEWGRDGGGGGQRGYTAMAAECTGNRRGIGGQAVWREVGKGAG